MPPCRFGGRKAAFPCSVLVASPAFLLASKNAFRCKKPRVVRWSSSKECKKPRVVRWFFRVDGSQTTARRGFFCTRGHISTRACKKHLIVRWFSGEGCASRGRGGRGGRGGRVGACRQRGDAAVQLESSSTASSVARLSSGQSLEAKTALHLHNRLAYNRIGIPLRQHVRRSGTSFECRIRAQRSFGCGSIVLIAQQRTGSH